MSFAPPLSRLLSCLFAIGTVFLAANRAAAAQPPDADSDPHAEVKRISGTLPSPDEAVRLLKGSAGASDDKNSPESTSEAKLEHLVGDAPDAHRSVRKNLVTGEDGENINPERQFGQNVKNLYRMPLGGMTNLHHPTSCSRKRNCDPRWLEVRQMVNLFLEQPFEGANFDFDSVINAMIGRRWDLSNCDCTCGACHTFLQECPLGHLVTKWMSFFGTTPAFRALIVYGNVLQPSDVGAVEGEDRAAGSGAEDAPIPVRQKNPSIAGKALSEFDIVEDYGSNILFMIRGNWGSYNLMQSGWPLYDVLLRLAQLLRNDGYPVESYIRNAASAKIDLEHENVEKLGVSATGVVVGSSGSVEQEDAGGEALKEKIIVAELAHRNAPILRKYEKPTWFCCFPTEYARVEQEVHVLKYNLKLVQFEKLSLGWYAFAADAVKETSTTSSSALEDGEQLLLREEEKTTAIRLYRSFEYFIFHARSELSRDFFRENSTSYEPSGSLEHHKALVSSHPFAKRVIDLDHLDPLLREDEMEIPDVDADVEGGAVVGGSGGVVTATPKTAAARNRKGNKRRRNHFGASREDFRDSRGVEFYVSHFEDGPRLVHEPDNVVWRLNLAHDRQQLPGFVPVRSLIAENNLTSKFFASHFEGAPTGAPPAPTVAGEAPVQAHPPTPASSSGASSSGSSSAKKRKQRSVVAPHMVERMQKQVRQVTKYLMPSCSLQQATALAEYVAEKVLKVDLDEISASGDNIFVAPSFYGREQGGNRGGGKDDKDAGQKSSTSGLSAEVDPDEVYSQRCGRGREADENRGKKNVDGMDDAKVAEGNRTSSHWSEELYFQYHKKSFSAMHGMSMDEWQKRKVRVPSWTELILERLNSEGSDFWQRLSPSQEFARSEVFPAEDGGSAEQEGSGAAGGSGKGAGGKGAAGIQADESTGASASKNVKPSDVVFLGPGQKTTASPSASVLQGQKTTSAREVRLSVQQLTELKQRLEIFLDTVLTEVDMLLHMWARWQRKGFFGALLALPEAGRLLKALSVIQRSITQEFYCVDKDAGVLDGAKAVGYQGEWKVEASVINLLSGGLGLNLQEEQEKIRRNLGKGVGRRVGADEKSGGVLETSGPVSEYTENAALSGSEDSTRVRQVEQLSQQLLQEDGESDASETDEDVDAVDSTTTWAVFTDAVTGLPEERTGTKKKSDQQHTTRKTTARVTVRKETAFAKQVSTRFAFVGVMFDNKEVDTYIRALRTLARSCYRVHRGKYRFIILSGEDLSVRSERKLVYGEGLFYHTNETSYLNPTNPAPTYNLEVRRVRSSELVKNPTFGVEAAENGAKIEWWFERKTAPTAVGFYRWKLTEFEKVIFLDADMLLTRPIDELFQVTAPLAVGVTPFATFRLFADMNRFPYLNIGVMVLTPNARFFDALIAALGDDN
eukprot:g14019.t1